MQTNFQQERKIVPSGATWIPLSRQLLKILKYPAIASKLLGNRSPNARNSQGTRVVEWNEDGYGIVRKGNNFQVVVCRPEHLAAVEEGLNELKNKIKSHINAEPTQVAIDLSADPSIPQPSIDFDFLESIGVETQDMEVALRAASEHEDIQPIIDAVTETLAPAIAIAVIDGYSVTGSNGLCDEQAFISRHYSSRVRISDVRSGNESNPGYTFTHTHQLESTVSDETGTNNSSIRLRSVVIPGALTPSEDSPDYTPASSRRTHIADPVGGPVVPDAMPRTQQQYRVLMENPEEPEQRVPGAREVIAKPDVMQEVVVNEGTINTLPLGPDAEPPLRSEGGSSKRTADRYESRHVGTRMQTTNQGDVSNPMGHLPSSSFNPAPEWLTSVFAGPIAFFSDPKVAFGVIGVVTLLQSDEENKHTYTQKYKTMPSMIVDNEKINENLFGAGAGYALGLGPTPDIGQPEVQE
jgi:hypothetical protein